MTTPLREKLTRLVEAEPTITIAELAQKADCSYSYASRTKADYNLANSPDLMRFKKDAYGKSGKQRILEIVKTDPYISNAKIAILTETSRDYVSSVLNDCGIGRDRLRRSIRRVWATPKNYEWLVAEAKKANVPVPVMIDMVITDARLDAEEDNA